MFNLQGSEIVIILLLALVVLGPEKLPDAMRKAGKAYSELKKMSSGFQSEFRSAVDEPLREIRDTANVLRDSADFTKFQDGERDEKPKSAEMAPHDPSPAHEVPTFDTPAGDGPATADDSQPAPFDEADGAADEAPARAPVTTEPTPIPSVAPFTGMSSAAPRPRDASGDHDHPAGEADGGAAVGEEASGERAAVEPARPQPFAGVSSAAPRPKPAVAAPDEPADGPVPTHDEQPERTGAGGSEPAETVSEPDR